MRSGRLTQPSLGLRIAFSGTAEASMPGVAEGICSGASNLTRSRGPLAGVAVFRDGRRPCGVPHQSAVEPEPFPAWVGGEECAVAFDAGDPELVVRGGPFPGGVQPRQDRPEASLARPASVTRMTEAPRGAGGRRRRRRGCRRRGWRRVWVRVLEDMASPFHRHRDRG